MKAVILAAGMGKRLGSHLPKCLVEVNGKSILERQVSILKNYVDEIIVVTGYKHAIVERIAQKLGVTTVWNPLVFCENIVSLFFGVTKVKGPFIILNGDTLVNENIIKHLVDTKGNVLVVERWKESENVDDPMFCHDYDKEAMKVEFDGKKILNVSKKIGRWESWGEYIGLAKIGNNRKLQEEVEGLIGNGYVHEWYESVFNAMIKKGIVFHPMATYGLGFPCWNEIDTKEDLEEARKFFYE